MAEGGEESGDKQHEPTQKRLDDARKRGEVAMSPDLATTGAYAGLAVAAGVFGAATLSEAGSVLASLLDRADTLSDVLFDGPATRPAGDIILAAFAPALPWLALPLAGVILAVIAQQGFAISTKKIAPKLSRISPLSNAKQKFGREGLFTFAKSAVKLVVFSLLLGILIAVDLETILGSFHISAAGVTELMLRLGFEFLLAALAISFVIGAVDLVWQRAEHLRKNRMSHKELMDETKESEGDPHLKQRRRQKGYDLATNRMIADVPGADVVIVNPTHYAVALRWDRGSGSAPVCVASGVDEVAARIREVAAGAGVPVHRDPPTARALHATLRIGEEIRPEHYRPVAAAIRFAEQARKRSRGGRRP